MQEELPAKIQMALRCRSIYPGYETKRRIINGYNGGWPSARLFGWSAADWSQPATNKSLSLEKKKKSIVLLRKEIMNKLVVDLLQQKGLGCWKVLNKRCKQKGKVFPQPAASAHKFDGLGKIKEHAPRSEHVHLHQDVGYIRKNHLQATLLPQLSKYAHASRVYLYCA